MNRLMLVPAFVAVCSLAGSLAAADSGNLQKSLEHKAPVLVDAPGGLVRLPLPAEVRAHCQPDLSDLRLLDAQQREVPFLVDEAGGATPPSSQSVEAGIVEAFREEHRPKDAPPLRRETFLLEMPEDLDVSLPWSLRVVTPSRDFVRRAEVSQRREDGEAFPLVEARSIFRLAGGARVRTSLELPGLQRGRLFVTLEGEDDAYLSPSFRFERTSQATEAARLDVPLAERSRRHEAGKTILVLARPPGIVPEQIRFDAAVPTFARAVVVRDVLATGRKIVVGQGTIRRLDASDQNPQLEIDVHPARGGELEIEVDDGDSPPLERVTTAAVVRELALVFSLPSGDPAVTLLFGGGRTRAPRYDIAALATLLDGTAGSARVGEIAANPAFEDRPLLGFAMRPGAALDARVFAYRRAVSIPHSRTGLARIRLEVEDLVAAAPDLADLRIVDAEGRQWPYLLERDAIVAAVPLETTRTEREARKVRSTFVPRSTPLRLGGFEIDVDAGFVDRAFTLYGRDESGKERRLAHGRLHRAAGEREALRVSFADARVTELELVVDSGDEAPLILTGVRALCPLSELYVAAPPGEYSLLAGDVEAEAPEYEITGLRSTVLAVPAVDAVTKSGGPNPAFDRGAAAARRIAGGKLMPRIAVWSVLVVAVVVLTLLTLRLVRREGPP